MARLLGLIGGVSPQSTPIYYRHLNDAAQASRGGDSSMPLLLYALDYGVMAGHYHAGRWDEFRAEVVAAAERLNAGGATALVITSNTTHIAAEAASSATGLPVIHIIDALAATLKKDDIRRPLLLGTQFVMEGDYYLQAFERRFGAAPMVPDPVDRALVSKIIFEELARGVVRAQSREDIQLVLARAAANGADAVILGCTELCMICDDAEGRLPSYDTTLIHARAAASYALRRE